MKYQDYLTIFLLIFYHYTTFLKLKGNAILQNFLHTILF